MKSASPELISHLNTARQFMMADCYSFILSSGEALHYTTWDKTITYNGTSFSASGPIIERDKVRTVVGVEVDTLTIRITPTDSDFVLGLPFLKAAALGAFDGSTVKLERVFLDAENTVIGGFIKFSGRLSDFQLSRTVMDAQVRSDLELLNIKFPKNLYQPGCVHSLYGHDCGVSREAFKNSGMVLSASRSEIVINIAKPASFFDMGYVHILSGALSGLKRTVKSHYSGTLELLNPLPSTPEPGDLISVYPGCDKTLNACKEKFNNLPGFRGFPFIPQPETAR